MSVNTQTETGQNHKLLPPSALSLRDSHRLSVKTIHTRSAHMHAHTPPHAPCMCAHTLTHMRVRTPHARVRSQSDTNLFGVTQLESVHFGITTLSKLASVKVHAPRTTEGEGRSTQGIYPALTSAVFPVKQKCTISRRIASTEQKPAHSSRSLKARRWCSSHNLAS